MKIETSFSVGDKVTFLHDNRVVHEKVCKLYIEKERENDLRVKYGFWIDDDYVIVNEGDCFVNKEELIKSL